MDIQKEREALIVEIERFKAEALKMYFIETWSESYKTNPFSYAIDDENKIIWMKAQARQLWDFWQQAQKVAVPEGFVVVPKEPTPNMMIAALAVISTGIGKDHIDVEIIQCWKKMIEAQEQVG